MHDDAGRKPFAAVVVDARGADESESLSRARPTLRRWRRTGLQVAVVCSRRGAHALPDHELFELVIDDSRDTQPALESSVRLFGEATLRVDTAPVDSLVVAHTVASVAAAQALRFRRIVGVERNRDGPGLLAAGARSVVDDLRGLRFPRVLPPALERLIEISEWLAGRSLAVFLDYDGTLTPIVARPGDARLAPEMAQVVETLSRRHPLAVVSGRDYRDLAQRVGIPHIHYAGSHGLDIAGPGTRFTAPGAREGARRLSTAAEAVEHAVRDISGVVVERKRFSVAVHYRQVTDPERVRHVVQTVEQTADVAGLHLRQGKQVREMVPDLDWHKGNAVEWLRETLELDPARTGLIYVGDDETDEDAFRSLGPDDIGLRPGPRVAASLADYHLPDVDAVCRFLQWLAYERT